MAQHVLAIDLDKCSRQPGRKLIRAYSSSLSLSEVFQDIHPGDDSEKKGTDFTVSINGYEVDGILSVADVLSAVDSTGSKTLKFSCKHAESSVLEQCAKEATQKTINAFQVLMAKGRGYPSKKKTSSGIKDGLTQKDALYNDLVDDFQERKLDFPKAQAESDGAYFVQVLCNALWYITNHHDRINDESRRKDVLGVPKAFEKYQKYNDTKKKKIKKDNMSSDVIESHSQALYSLLLKPVLKSSAAWCIIHDEIKALADCLSSYKSFLDKKTKEISINHHLEHPVRTVGEYTTVEHRNKSNPNAFKDLYGLIDQEVASKDEGSFIFFDEDKHVNVPFASNLQRFRFLAELQLTVPVDVYKFCPGGSIVTTVCIVKTKEQRSEKELLVDGARFVAKNKHLFREYHTRSMKRAFKNKISNIVHIPPMVLDYIYKELTLDASVTDHPDTQERLRLISLGETDLIGDLRHCNPGRPSDKFDLFFEQLALLVEETTAADERRHGTAHLSEWISLSDLIQRAKEKCPENTLIPSKSLVRLQFAPRNPYAKTAWNFTSKINLQYKIQRRQLRISHPDQHYCNALFKYFKEKAIELNKEDGVAIAMFSCDDKAKVPVGEPGFAVSTGVRGKQTIAPTSTTLVAADHDMTKASLTPSVSLECTIPDTVEESFVRGQVTVTVNDSVFQTSNPFRHGISLAKLLSGRTDLNVLMMYTDGGVDHRNTLESVKCASICLFRELNLDMFILGRCAPGHSWRNPAERVMSVLNLGLQNCSLERVCLNEENEKMLKKCGSMAEIREMANKNPQLKYSYKESVEPIQSVIGNRFRRLKLKDDPIRVVDPVSDEEINSFKRHLRELFPEMDLEKLQKVHTSKVRSYMAWKEEHCRERQYVFQIRKCKDPNCCIPSTLTDVTNNWLPDPVLSEDTEHYKSYSEVKGTNTTEDDRPTFQTVRQTNLGEKGKKRKNPSTAPASTLIVQQEVQVGDFFFSAQTARSTIQCVECSKPRIVYSKLKLSGRQELQLAELVSDFAYTCGAPLTPPAHNLHGKTLVRLNLDCSSPIETPYYSASVGPCDICFYCGINKGDVNQELKNEFKTVLPVCEACLKKSLKHPCYRPYGKNKKPKK